MTNLAINTFYHLSFSLWHIISLFCLHHSAPFKRAGWLLGNTTEGPKSSCFGRKRNTNFQMCQSHTTHKPRLGFSTDTGITAQQPTLTLARQLLNNYCFGVSQIICVKLVNHITLTRYAQSHCFLSSDIPVDFSLSRSAEAHRSHYQRREK